MKKIISMMLATALVFSMSAVAFAATSVSGSGSSNSSTSSSWSVDDEVEGGWYYNGVYYYPDSTTVSTTVDVATDVVTSPVTGESNVALAAMGVMALAGVSACTLLRKKEEN